MGAFCIQGERSLHKPGQLPAYWMMESQAGLSSAHHKRTHTFWEVEGLLHINRRICCPLPKVLSDLGLVLEVYLEGPSQCVVIQFIFISFSTLYLSPGLPSIRIYVAREWDRACYPLLYLWCSSQCGREWLNEWTELLSFGAVFS